MHLKLSLSKVIFIVSLFCMGFPLDGHCQVQHEYSITIAPIKLIDPIIEGTFEKRITRKIGIQAIVGAGSYDGLFAFSIGGAWKYYLIGSFEHALQTGVELYYQHLGSNDVEGSGVSAGAAGLLIGPLLGYKYISDYGLTLDFSIVGGPLLFSATASGDGESATIRGETFALALNLNAGWSF